MKLFAVFGKPVSHSRSPDMHNLALRRLGIYGCYKKIEANSAAEVVEVVKTLGLNGANITVPFKEDILTYLDEVDGFAARANAANTVVVKNGKLHGYNTDAEGFYRMLSPKTKSALILGAGGSAKAIALFLKQKGVAVDVLNRSDNRRGFFDEAGIPFFTEAAFSVKKYDAVINATSAGLDSLVVPFESILREILKDKNTECIDIMYGKETPFLNLANSMGHKSQDGAMMLVNQGVLAFNLFFENRYGFGELEPIFREGFLE